MNRQCAVATYNSFEAAQEAVRLLDESKFPSQQISLVANSVHQDLEETLTLQYGDEAETDAALGAGIGGLLGLFTTAPLMLIPGFGLMLIGGPIVAGMTGAVVGGLLGSLMGWGVHEDHVAQYEQQVREGKFLVVANGDPFEVDFAKQVLADTGPESIRVHSRESAEDSDPKPTV